MGIRSAVTTASEDTGALPTIDILVKKFHCMVSKFIKKMVYLSTSRQTTGVEETDSVAAERTQHYLKAARLLFELINVSFQKFMDTRLGY